jgi:hypothetical protein
MVRSAITPNICDGSFNTAETPDAIDKTNDHVIAINDFDNMVLAVHLSAATAADTITIKAGTALPAFRRSLGDLTYSCAGGAAEVVFGPIETARFIQSDGTIHIDIAGATIAGTIEAYVLP